MTIAPLRLAYYKGVQGRFGAIQFNLQKPHYFCSKCKKKDFVSVLPAECCDTKMESREGCIFMEITTATGPNKYDWDKKIIFSMSTHDMAQVLFALETGEETKLMHDPGAKSATSGQITKNFNISSPKGIKAGVMMSVSMKKADSEEAIRHTVPLSGPEARELSVFLRAALVTSLAWT
jgi:hypothetical protein